MAQFNLLEAFDPEYISDLEQLSMDGLRAKRDACVELETELSYLRRLAQARIDLVLAESQRRHGGAGQETTEDLVQRLPQILADHDRQDGPGRLPSLLAPGEGEQALLTARVEQVLPSDQLGSLGEMAPSQLDGLLTDLSELEQRVSSERRALHDIQDRLQDELVRRYRSGEADVRALLN